MGGDNDIEDSHFYDAQDIDENSGDSSSDGNILLAHATMASKNKSHPGDLRKMLSSPSKSNNNRKPGGIKAQSTNVNNSSISKEVFIDGKRYVQADVHIIYHISAHNIEKYHSLVDRGANGGIAGEDVRVLPQGICSDHHVNVRGIDNHELSSIPLASVGGVVTTQFGDVIAIFHQYAYVGRGKTIHSSAQLEFFKNDVNDKSIKVPGGLQRIQTNDVYCMPLRIISGLPYLPLRPYTDHEWDSLPHITMTSDSEWDPTVIDHCFNDDDEIWFDTTSNLSNPLSNNLFDDQGNYLHRTIFYAQMEDNKTFYDNVAPFYNV